MMLIYTALALLFLYGILFHFYRSWWKDIPDFIPAPAAGGEPTTRISLIIPARNEEAQIAACLQSIYRQNYPAHLLEVILIDDNSTDSTLETARHVSPGDFTLVCYRLPPVENNRAPKKRAIEKGISMATGELIVTTDADCTSGPDWLRTIAAFRQQSKNVFMAAPVKIAAGRSLLSKFQALDFLTMQGITGAAVSKRFHNMCNGANLAYEKKVFHEVGGFAGIDHIASGDDMLLMNKIAAAYPAQLGFIRSQAAIVTTLPAKNWKAFLQQRIRWASKATHYRQPAIFLVLLLVYITNLLLLGFLVMGSWQTAAFFYFALLCTDKFFMEVFFVFDVANFFQQKKLLPWLFLLQPLHIFYIVVSGLLGQFKTYEWKGRKLK